MQPQQQNKPLTRASMRAIDELVCLRLGNTHEPTNAQPWVEYRQVAMYLMSQSGWALQQIGRRFNKHHTTVLHSVDKIAEQRRIDFALDAQLRQLETEMAGLPVARFEEPVSTSKPPRRVMLRNEDLHAIAHEVAALLRVAGGSAA